LPLAAQVVHGRLAGPYQVAHGFVRFVGHPDGGQFAGPEQASELLGITPISLDPVARLARDQRGCDDRTLVPQFDQLSMQSVAGRPGLVAKV
jgi:hypothetical protein